ncbi:MAG TPA: plastocyanin/azurin family copper-binding protein [Solirubrobacteraceae bacterium]|jgi:plastocyanin
MKRNTLIGSGAALAAVAAAAVVAVPVTAGATSAHGAKATAKHITVADDYFSKSNLKIKKGGAVNFVWSPQNFESHNVTLVKGPKGVKHGQFTSVTGSTGIRFKRTFKKPGVYHFICTIHPGTMILTLTVSK